MRNVRWVLVAAVIALAAPGCSKDSDAARIEKIRQSGDVEALAVEVQGGSADTARLAVRAMASLGPTALPHVERALEDSRPEVREEAAVAYSRVAVGAPMQRLAAVARKDPSDSVRAAAVTGLGNARALDEMEALLAAAEDPDAMVRERATTAIARIIGRRYELYVDGTPEERHAAVGKLREQWPQLERDTRAYYESLRRKPAAK